MKFPVTQLDIENAQNYGISRKNAQYERIKNEKRIKCILILDEYLNYIADLGIIHCLDYLSDSDMVKLRRVMEREPFHGDDLPPPEIDTFMAALDEDRYKKFISRYDTDISFTLDRVLFQTPRTYNELLDIKENVHEV